MENTERFDIYWMLLDALDRGWLSLDVEAEIREICRRKSIWQTREIKILEDLKQAVQNGIVRREALENYRGLRS
jgi:ribosomal protein S13